MKRKLRNPFNYYEIQMLGLFPLFICFLLERYVSIGQLEYISMAAGLGIMIVQCWRWRHGKFSFPMLTMCGSVLFLLASVIFVFPRIYDLFPIPFILNAVFLIHLFIINFDRNRIKTFLYRNSAFKEAKVARQLTEFFYITKILFHISLMYFIGGIILNIFIDKYEYEHYFEFYNKPLIIGLYLLLLAYEIIRVLMINSMFKKEIFLPYLNDRLEISGIVSKKESLASGTKYNHPHVRLFILCQNKIFLSRAHIYNELYAPDGYIDTPFSWDVTTQCSIKEKMDSTIYSAVGSFKYPARLIIKNKFVSLTKQRYIYLYILNLNDEKLLNRNLLKDGKFWTKDQIETNLGTSTFPSIFEDEFQFMKETVFYAYEQTNLFVDSNK